MPKKRLLHCVLGVFERAEHSVGVHLELAAVRLDQRRERGLVAVTGGRDGVALELAYLPHRSL
jgi:hypothetical protein